MTDVSFEIGQRIERRRIHDRFGGNPQCGISYSAQTPCVFVFTGEVGTQYGYEDRFVSETEFEYSGQGQTGDQTFDTSTTNGRANAALRDHEAEGREVHLFEKSSVDSSQVVYLGEYEYVRHHFEERQDANGVPRDEIRFLLRRVDEDHAISGEAVTGESIRELAEAAAETDPDRVLSDGSGYSTSATVRRYALGWADGVCQGCGEEAPFVTPDGNPYLEVHHVFRLGDGGPDHPDAVIALCPNCHRRVHHGRRGTQFNQELVETLRDRAEQEAGEVPPLLRADPDWG